MRFKSHLSLILIHRRQYYKLNGEPAIAALERDQLKQNAVIDELVTSFVAMKSVMS